MNSSQVVVDATGAAHVLFGGTVDAFTNYLGEEWDTRSIYYFAPAQPDMQPLDVLYADNAVSLWGASYDAALNELVALWSAGTALNLSRAPADNPANAQQWATSTLVSSDVLAASLALDHAGVYHVAYALRQDAKLEYMRSKDKGVTWTLPTTVQLLASGDRGAITRVRLIDDPNGTLHMTWTEAYPVQGSWNPRTVWYAHVVPGAEEIIQEVGEVGGDVPATTGTKDYLNVSVSPTGARVRTWSHGVGSVPGRLQQRWLAEQAVWGPVEPILDGESGLGGYNHILWDATGTPYQLSSGQKAEGSIFLGLYVEQGEQWVLQDRVAGCEGSQLSLYRGNQIHISCVAVGRVSYVRGDLAVEAGVDATSNSTPAAPEISVIPVPTARLALQATVTAPAQAAGATATRTPLSWSPDPPRQSDFAVWVRSNSLVSVVLAGVLVVVGVLVVQFRRSVR